MVDQRLIDYIKKELSAGYQAQAIRNYLVKYGYNPAAVDEAMKAALAKPAAPKKLPILPIVGGILAIFLIIIMVLIFSTGRKEAEVVSIAVEKVDLKVSMISSNVRQGNDVQFNLILTNLNKKSYDIGMIYNIIDSNGVIINQKEDLISLEQKYIEQKSVELPPDVQQGEYQLVVTGRFDNEVIERRLNFGVLSAGAEKAEEIVEVVEVECPVSCDDNNPCTQDSCSAATAYECVHFIIQPCCGNLKCEDYESYQNCPTDCSPPSAEVETGVVSLSEITQTAQSYASTNLGQAESYCNSLSFMSQKDSCWYVVSQTSKLSKYCGNIGSELKRDNCYSEYALAGDFSVCDDMTNIYMKESCYELEEASESPGLR